MIVSSSGQRQAQADRWACAFGMLRGAGTHLRLAQGGACSQVAGQQRASCLPGLSCA